MHNPITKLLRRQPRGQHRAPRYAARHRARPRAWVILSAVTS